MSVLPDDHDHRGLRLSKDDATATALVEAIHGGDVDSLRKLLGEHPGLAAARIVDPNGGSATLHAATDWPGFFPNGREIVRILIAAGADPDAAIDGSWHAETALHWTASSDDVEVARALIDGGAGLNGTASWGDRTPLDVAESVDTGREALLTWLRERGAKNSTEPAV
ncbi:MAG TPA: ankyrin repeat domain-containing protein [Solirubrobacteraceae bacterium]|nr:ankyrin repeat domain-containing protein [Solirubrobacteraceae bacterium]